MSAAAKVDEAEMSLAAFGSPSEGCGELDRQANARRVPLDLARPAARRAIESRIALASEARLRVVEGVAVKIDKKQARALVERLRARGWGVVFWWAPGRRDLLLCAGRRP